MFQKLEAVENRYEELNKKIADPEVIANTSDIEQNIIPMISNFKDLKIIIRTRNTVNMLANIMDITMLNILLVIMFCLQIVY